MSSSFDDIAKILNQRAGTYEVLKLLGEGYASSVYLVKDLNTNKELILKFLRGRSFFDELSFQCFSNQDITSKDLRHLNIVEVYEYFESGDDIACLMENVRGGDLSDKLKDPVFSNEDIDDVFIQILSGLRLAHENKIFHRGLKLENILIDTKGVVKISDFWFN